MKIVYTLLGLVLLLSYNSENPESKLKPREFTKVEIDILLQDSLLNVRALEVIPSAESCVFLTSNGNFGAVMKNESDYIKDKKPKVFYPTNLNTDSIIYNFRSMAVTFNRGMGLTIGSPAFLLDINIYEPRTEILYQENHPKTFYDSMDFWNDQEGIAIGDAIDGCISVIITRDGGETWTKLTCDQLPRATENEGAFAASDTNIAIVGNKTWVATTAGRVYYSEDKGKTWEVYQTPIVSEKETEGIYSIHFYDEKNGFAIGGDYTKPEDNAANKILTKDGGKTWELVAKNQDPGYRSCVQYIPNSKAKELVAIGFKGIDYSNDGGYNWKHLSDEGFYTIRFVNDSTAYAAGNGRIAKLTFKE